MSSEKRESELAALASSGEKEKDAKKKKKSHDQLLTAERSRVNECQKTFGLSNLPAPPKNSVVHAATDRNDISNNSDPLPTKNSAPAGDKKETPQITSGEENGLDKCQVSDHKFTPESKSGKKGTSQETKKTFGPVPDYKAPQNSGVTSKPQSQLPQPKGTPQITLHVQGSDPKFTAESEHGKRRTSQETKKTFGEVPDCKAPQNSGVTSKPQSQPQPKGTPQITFGVQGRDHKCTPESKHGKGRTSQETKKTFRPK